MFLQLLSEAVVNRDPKGERILELLQENKAKLGTATKTTAGTTVCHA